MAEADVSAYSQARPRARVDVHYRGVWTSLQRASQRLRGIRPRALEVRLAINAEHARRLESEIAATPDAAKLRPGSPPRMQRPVSRGLQHSSKRHVQILDPRFGDDMDGSNTAEYELPAYVEELLAELDQPLETYEQDLYEPTSRATIAGNARASMAGALIASIQNETDSSRLPGLALLGLGLGLSPEVMFQGASLPVPVEAPPPLQRETAVSAIPPEHDDDQQEQYEDERTDQTASSRPIFRVRSGCNMPLVRRDMAPAGFVPAALWGPPADPSRQAAVSSVGMPPAIQVRAVKNFQQLRPDTLTSVLLLHQKAGLGLPNLPSSKVRGSILAWKAAQRQAKTAGKAADLAKKDAKSGKQGTRRTLRASTGDPETRRASVSAIWGGDAFANEGYSGFAPACSSHSCESSDGFRSQASRRLQSKLPLRDGDMPMIAKVSAETHVQSSFDVHSHSASPTSSATSTPRGSFRRFGGGGLSPAELEYGADVSPPKSPFTETGSPRIKRVAHRSSGKAKLSTLPAWLHAAHEELEGSSPDLESRICGSQGYRAGMVVRSSTAPPYHQRPSTD